MCIEDYENNFGSFKKSDKEKSISMELLIELHYEVSDINSRLNKFDFDFLKQILELSEKEIRRQMLAK